MVKLLTVRAIVIHRGIQSHDGYFKKPSPIDWEIPVLSAWWYTYPSEKYEFVSWDYYSQYDGKNNPNVPVTTNQII